MADNAPKIVVLVWKKFLIATEGIKTPYENTILK